MPDQPQEPEIAWVGAEDLPVEFANIFSAVIGENAIFLNLGSMVPPTVESEEQFASLRFIPVKPIARIALTPGNLDHLVQTLENARREREDFKRELDEES